MIFKNKGEGVKKQRQTSLKVITQIIRNEGVSGLYVGLSAGIFRQATYTTARLGTYTSLLDKYKETNPNPSFVANLLIGMTAGAVGAFVGTPSEVALIRMTSDGRLPLDQRRNYKNVFNALMRISREEGVLTLWRGCLPTIGRAMVVNASQLVSYSKAKAKLIESYKFKDGILCHFCASMFSGLVTTFFSMPVDIAKTRVQNMKIIDGKPEYRGAIVSFVDAIFKWINL